MIKSPYVEIKVSNNQIKYWRQKGYSVKGGNELVTVKVSDLPLHSGQKIKVVCDICGQEKEITLNRYNINTKQQTEDYACSRKCATQKNQRTVQIKYGVDNVSQLTEIKKKKEQTCFQNYGVAFPQKNEVVFEKSKKTKQQKYGSEFYNNEEQRFQTCLTKYGYPSPAQNELIKKKIKQRQFETNKALILEKYQHLDIIDYDEKDKYFLKCPTGEHNFYIDYKLLWQRLKNQTKICTICNPIGNHSSGLENELLSFIQENYTGEVITNSKQIISPLELDIYLPELKLAFEFNGLYWHNELNKDKKYHFQKTEACEEQGLHLIHIYEDDWLYKKEIIQSRILNLLGQSERIYARKCEVKEIKDNKLIRQFLENNHLQGFVGSKVKLGLFYENKLVSLMTLGAKRRNMNSSSQEGEYELLRFCNQKGLNVVGGASKLFKYFVRNYQPIEVISYADRSWSQGHLYENLGFNLIHKTPINYFYIVDGLRRYRFNYRKDKLVREGFDPSKSEHEIMLERGIYRIYDSGSLKYQYQR
jgi:hypothetical protein